MAVQFRSIADVTRDALRTELLHLLAQCTEKQQARFVELFGDVDALKDDMLRSSIALCHRTLRVNAVASEPAA